MSTALVMACWAVITALAALLGLAIYMWIVA